MKSIVTAVVLIMAALAAAVPFRADAQTEPVFHPIRHASLIIESPSLILYVDPVGEPEVYSQYPEPDIILITHAHGDHLDAQVIQAVSKSDTRIIASRDAAAQVSGAEPLDNGGRMEMPGYNLPPERLKFHPRGRDNGYLLTLAGRRIYISGDTEDIPEMRALRNIDYAFVCMNLPYTMTVDQAASAVLAFRPRVVIPYHYRGKNGFSDLERFKTMVETGGATEVRLLNWY